MSYNLIPQSLKEFDLAIEIVTLNGKNFDNMERCIDFLSSDYQKFEMIETASTCIKTENLIKSALKKIIDTGVCRQTIRKYVVQVHTRKTNVSFAILKNLFEGTNYIILTSYLNLDVNLDVLITFLKKVYFAFLISSL